MVYFPALVDMIGSGSPLLGWIPTFAGTICGQAVSDCTLKVEIVNAAAQKSTASAESILNNTSTVVGILLSIITGVGIMIGWGYFKSLKEKQSSATFTFWSQIKMHITRIYNLLEADPQILNNMYPPQSRAATESTSSLTSRVEELKELAETVLHYLESTSDQMPPYVGWSSDFSTFLTFVSDVIQYDVSNPREKFLETDDESKKTGSAYRSYIRGVMKQMLDGIDKRQAEAEKKICK